MKKLATVTAALVLSTALVTMCFAAGSKEGNGTVVMGKSITINDDYSFQYGWTEKPKMGSSTLKINIFNAAGEKVNDLVILGSYDMPSMSGHYYQKPTPIAISRNNDYLMPVQTTMAGEWIITVTFQKEGQELHTETITVRI